MKSQVTVVAKASAKVPFTVDDYIAAVDPAAQPLLQEIRRVVQRAVPQAQETIAYKMPAFRQGRIFMYAAAFKRHIGVFPPLKSDDALRAELQPFANEKGNLRFALDKPIPFDLIERLAKALAVQYGR